MLFNYLAYFLCKYFLIELEKDDDIRIDAEMIKKENDLIKPLLII